MSDPLKKGSQSCASCPLVSQVVSLAPVHVGGRGDVPGHQYQVLSPQHAQGLQALILAVLQFPGGRQTGIHNTWPLCDMFNQPSLKRWHVVPHAHQELAFHA